MERDHDGTPIFSDAEDAAATLENPDLSRDDRLAAELAADAMRSGYTASELDGYETISTGQADDLKHETADGLRYWLSRCGVEDGEPFEHTVTIERQVDGKWINAARYDGGELEPRECEECGEEFEGEACEECGWSPNAGERGKFVLEIHPGNAAMQDGAAVASALAEVASVIGESEPTAWNGEGIVRDGNGNTVGRWTFHDHN